MPSLTCFKFRFTPSWITIGLSSLFIMLFIRLGFWQIHRADEKKSMLKAEAFQAARESLAWETKQQLPKQYQKISLKGHFLDQVFLLDNQHVQHQFGYNILSPLLLANGNLVLIDRGWVVGDPSRQQFPEIQTIHQLVNLKGRAYFPSKKTWLLGPNMEKMNDGMAIIENIDTQLLSQILQKKVYPFIMRLDKEDANGFVREWAIVSMPFQRHLAYAFQWFAMAFAIFVLFVALNLKRHDEQSQG